MAANPRPPWTSKRTRNYTTRELSRETWQDFSNLFAKYGGVQAGCWCMFYHRARPIQTDDTERLRRPTRNRRDKEALVSQGRSHGILVYADGVSVGWCQYGSREELPRIDSGRNYRKLDLPHGGARLWRITCFFVDRDHRRSGVARMALRTALSSIERRGGGIVEAYPATNPRAVAIWFGTVAMFEAEGFRKVATLGRSNVVMRRTLRRGRSAQRDRGTEATTKTPPPNSRSSRTFSSRGTNR